MYNYLDNASTLHHYSPHQMVTGQSPANFLRSLRSFGTACVVTVPGTKPKTYEAIYLGHSVSTESPDQISGHWVLVKSQPTHAIKRAHHVRFADTVPRIMADETIVNLRSKFEDDEDQLDLLWSAIDLDEIMDPDETFIENEVAPESPNGAGPEPPAGLTIMPHQVVPPPNHGPPSEDSNTADTVSNAGDIAEPDPTAVAHVPGDWIDIDLWDAEQHSHLSSAPSSRCQCPNCCGVPIHGIRSIRH